MKLVTVARTALQIGLVNCARVALYRGALKIGFFRRLMPIGEAIPGPFLINAAAGQKAGDAEFAMFGWQKVPLDPIPDWHSSPFFPGSRADDKSHWSRVPDFSAQSGDIKAVWELSRFDWAPQLAFAASAGRSGSAELLENLICDWSKRNPFSRGANWKCAQEASLRLLNILYAAALLKIEPQHSFPALRRFVAEHVLRILPTTSYAIGQQNNHATSEAAGLMVAGMWLQASQDPRWRNLAVKAERRGRRLFEKGVRALVMEDGCFAQYSVNYHRLFLATSVALDGFRRKFGRPDFSGPTRAKLARAAEWLEALVDPISGIAPLLGANDGANVLNPGSAPYHDMRPVSQAASLAFAGKRPLTPPLLLQVFPEISPKLTSGELASGDKPAVIIFKNERVRCILRLPTYQFRPSQADCFHLDVWIDGKPLFMDGGTVSYADTAINAELSGIAAHNTVVFDGHEPMPRLGRFLFGDWIGLNTLDVGDSHVAASYKDRNGAIHHRFVAISDRRIEVVDKISGYSQRASLSWRLASVPEFGEAGAMVLGGCKISFESDAPAEFSVRSVLHGAFYLRPEQADMVTLSGQNVCRFVTKVELPPFY